MIIQIYPRRGYIQLQICCQHLYATIQLFGCPTYIKIDMFGNVLKRYIQFWLYPLCGICNFSAYV